MASLRDALRTIHESKCEKFYGSWTDRAHYIGMRFRGADADGFESYEDSPRSRDTTCGVTVRSAYKAYKVDGGADRFEVMPDVVEEPCVHIDESAFFQLYRRVKRMMDIEFPVYAYFIDSCQLIRDTKIPSIGVTFDEVLGRYCIYYNPRWCLDFCVRYAQHTDKNNSVEMNLIRAFQFLLMHEVSHVFRKHVNGGMIKTETREEHQLNNLFEDAFINNELMKTLDVFGMPEGVLNLVTVCGEAPRDYTQDEMIDLVVEWLEGFADLSVERYWISNDELLTNCGEDVYIDFQFSDRVYHELFGDSSVRFVERMKQLVQDIFDNYEVEDTDFSVDFSMLPPIAGDSGGEMTADSDTESQSAQSGASGDGGESEDGSDEVGSDGDGGSGDGDEVDGERTDEVGSDGDGESSENDRNGENGDLEDRSTGGNSQKSEEVEDSESGDDAKDPSRPWKEERPSPLERAVFRDILNGAYDSANQAESDSIKAIRSGSGRGGGGGESALLEKMGVTRLVTNRQMTPLWKRRLRSLLSDCISSTEEYDAERPHARIEGQFGSEIDVDYPQRIVLGIDCSGSMGPEKFREVLNEIDNFLKVSRLYEVEIPVVYWGDRAVSQVFRYSRNLLDEIEESAVGCGGTELCTLVDEVKQRFRRYDALIIFTDGDFWSITRDEFNSLQRKPLWVITSDGSTDEVRKIDRGFKRRLIHVGQVR